MSIPFVIDNVRHRLSDTLNDLLAQSVGKPLDIATAYFAISGYRLVKEGFISSGLSASCSGPSRSRGPMLGLKVDPQALKARIKGDLEAEPFTEETLKLVEDLIAFLRADKVEVRLYDKGFLHAKAYLFHQDKVGPHNRADRLRPFAAIVGSSNFTGPGLVANRELNLVHRVFLPADDPRDAEAAEGSATWAMTGSGSRSSIRRRRSPRRRPAIHQERGRCPGHRRPHGLVRAPVGRVDRLQGRPDRAARRQQVRRKEYTPYEVYTKALYEYFKEELGADAPELGRSAVDLAEFQEDAVKKARRILARYDGVLIADSVGLGKTWIGKKLLEDFAYHRRQKAVVVCPASLRAMWKKELGRPPLPPRFSAWRSLDGRTSTPRPTPTPT